MKGVVMPNTSFFDTMDTIFPVLFAAVATLIVAGFVFVIVQQVRNARKVHRAGHDPFTVQADLANRALDSELLRPVRGTAERLAELDRLRAADTITADEYSSARATVLAGT